MNISLKAMTRMRNIGICAEPVNEAPGERRTNKGRDDADDDDDEETLASPSDLSAPAP